MAGPFAELAQLIANVATLADKGAAAIAASTEPAIKQVLEAEYEQGRGPDGEQWARLKRDGSPSHLQDTGAMRANTNVVRGVRGVSVSIPKPGGFHQSGTKRMAARKLVPDGEPLPPSWESAAHDAAASTITSILKK